MSVITELKKLDGQSGLEFLSILEIIEDIQIPVNSVKLRGQYGLATIYGLYFDFEKLYGKITNDTFIYYAILHEIAHYKRINKLGSDYLIKSLSTTSLTEYLDFLLNEEIIADRWARLVFYKLNGKELPIEYTQELDLEDNKKRFFLGSYKNFGIINNDISNYDRLINDYILETYE